MARAMHNHLAQARYGDAACPACLLIRPDVLERHNMSAVRFDPIDVLVADFGPIRHA
jgi:hypothetical protein